MKKVFYLSLVAATSLMAKSVLLQSIDVVATEPKKYDGNSTIKQGEFMGSSVYDRGYLDRTLSGNGDISEIIKRNPNARTSLGTRTSKNQGEILPQNISINAASVYQNSFLLDGVGINNDINPLGGDIKTGQAANRTPFLPNPSQGLNIDTSLLKEIEVMDSSVSAKYGGFQGGVVKASTRDPRQGFHGKIHFSHTRDSWQKTHIDDSEIENFEYSTDTALYQPDFKKYKAGIILEGFVDENFGLLFNYNQTKSKIYQQYYPQDYDIDTSKVGEKRKLSRKNENFFLKGVWYVNDRLTIRPSISYAPYEGTYYSINGVNAGARVEGGGLNTALESEYLGRWGIYTQTFSYSKQEMSRKTDGDRMFVWQRSLKNEGQGSRRFSTFVDGVGGDVDQDQKRFSYAFDVKFNEFSLGDTSHNVIAGLNFEKTEAKYDIKTPYYHAISSKNLGRYNCDLDDMFCSTDPVKNRRYDWRNGQYFDKYNYLSGRTKVDMKSFGFYLEDRIEFGRVTLRPGFRLDKNDYMGDLTFAPRISANLDLFDNDKTNIFGGYNRYYARSIFAYKLRDGMSSLEKSYKRKNPNSPWEYDKSGLNNYNFSDLDIPYDDEYVLGLSQKLGNFEISAKYLRREGRDLIRKTNARNMGLEGDGKTIAKNYSFYTNEGRSDTDIYTLKLRSLVPLEILGTYNNFEISYNYTDTSRNFNNYDDIFDDYNPNASKVVYNGNLIHSSNLPKNTNDIPWNIVATTITQIPSINLTLSNFFTWQGGYDGIIKNGRVVVDGKSYTNYKDKKFDKAFMWDASARLDIPMPKDTNAYVKLDVYNILNSDNAVSISSSGYLEYDAGRQFWLEVGYEW